MQKRQFALSLLSFVLLNGLPVFAEDRQPARSDDDQAISAASDYHDVLRSSARQYVESVEQVGSAYIETLDGAMRDATKAGDLDEALHLRELRQNAERQQGVIPNPLALLPEDEMAGKQLGDGAVSFNETMLTAQPWYRFNPVGPNTTLLVQFLADGSVRVLEGAQLTAWDDERMRWSYSDGVLTLHSEMTPAAEYRLVDGLLFTSSPGSRHRHFLISRSPLPPGSK